MTVSVDRNEIESRVLDGLKELMIAPGLVAALVDEFQYRGSAVSPVTAKRARCGTSQVQQLAAAPNEPDIVLEAGKSSAG